MRTFDQVTKDALAYISRLGTVIDVQMGEPMRDVAIDAPSLEFVRSYYVCEYLRKIQSLTGFGEILDDTSFKLNVAESSGLTYDEMEQRISDDLDALVRNWDIERKVAVKAKTILDFRYTSGGIKTVPVNFRVMTEIGVSFIATNAVIGSAVYDSSLGLYVLKVEVECEKAGIVGNVAAGMIIDIQGTLPDLHSVINSTAVTSGIEEESSLTLIDRAYSAWRGRVLSTPYGYKKFVTAIDGVGDALVVGPGNELMQRSPVGAVDIYVLGAESAIHTYSKGFDSGSPDIILQKQPVMGTIFSVVGARTYVQGTDFNLVFDRGEFGGSIKGLDKIVWIPGRAPAALEVLTITYPYNKLIATVQDQLDVDMNRVIVSDILVRASKQILINLEMQIILFEGFNRDDVQTVGTYSIWNRLSEFFSGFILGEDVDVSDVVKVIAATDGVDRVNTDIFKMGREDGTMQKVSDIAGGAVNYTDKEYARLGTITFL